MLQSFFLQYWKQRWPLFLWDETQDGRGSCEVGTCLNLYINCVAGGVSPIKHLTFCSDTCSGQKRNKFIAAALHYSLMNIPNVESANHKFFESGHSQMESDSIHSAIEQAKKKTKVFVPSQWETVVNFARKTNPYMVIPMKYSDFRDFMVLIKNNYKNMKVGTNGKRAAWHQVKWIQVCKSSPDSILFNYNFNADNFIEVNIKTKTRTAGRPAKDQLKLPYRYSSNLPISATK